MTMNFIANQTTAKAERRQHDGREFLVAPTIAIVEGVMNGLLYTEDEMTRFIEVWNGKPLSLSHPKDQAGNHISANSPDQHAKSIGFFFNAKFENGKLKGEWWIDTEKASRLGGNAAKVVEMLDAGQLLEQSTGLFLDVEPVEGVFNNKSYTGIARNIRPDHVAILLNEEGACSIEDGCGTPRVNAEQDQNGNIATRVINKVESLFNKIMEHIAMSEKQRKIDALVANERCPFDAEYLQNASDEQLEGLETLLATNEQSATQPDPDPVIDNDGTVVELPEEVNQLVSIIDELGGVEAFKQMAQSISANSNQERGELVAQIVANTNFTEDELGNIGVEQLRKMADMAQPKPTGVHLRPLPTTNAQDDGWEEYTFPQVALNGKAGE